MVSLGNFFLFLSLDRRRSDTFVFPANSFIVNRKWWSNFVNPSILCQTFNPSWRYLLVYHVYGFPMVGLSLLVFGNNQMEHTSLSSFSICLMIISISLTIISILFPTMVPTGSSVVSMRTPQMNSSVIQLLIAQCLKHYIY